jgi:5-(carboxyamino)imidazole ribonucleotide synthase
MSKAFYDQSFQLGILGGGQLGRMFIQEAVNVNLSVHILDPDPNAPCKEIASSFTNGSLKDYDTVLAFGKDKDLVTIEIEHVNVDALEELEKRGVKVYPQPSALRIIQDKGLQKKFYVKHHIPTPDFYLVESKADIDQYRSEFPFMQKMRVGGYDGKGVTPLRNDEELNSAFDAPSVLEKFVDLDKELSVIVARTPSGKMTTFPVVELAFNPEANLVDFLFSPANISEAVETKAREIAESVAEKLEIVGLLAVELFLDKSGEVLVNEIAPRPHNSGHQTIEGNYTSQFAQHMRSILDLPLGSTDITMPSVMVNVLGEKGFQGDVVAEGLEECLSLPGVYIHLYGKKVTKPFRKMGHVTVTNPNLETAKSLAMQVKDTLKIKSK